MQQPLQRQAGRACRGRGADADAPEEYAFAAEPAVARERGEFVADALGCDEALFRKVVKQAFNQRRKMLRNTMKPFFEQNPVVLEEKFFTQRPEVLTVQDFVGLTNRVEGKVF